MAYKRVRNAPRFVCQIKEPCEECPSYSGSLSFGYDSDYVWRGLQFADENIWGDINYTFDLSTFHECLGELTLGVWSLKGQPGTYEETNLYASYGLPSVLGFDASLEYINYRFADAAPEINEVGLALSRDIFGTTVGYYAGYLGDDARDWYHELSFGRTIELTDCISLEIGSGIAYWDIGNDSVPGADRGISHRFYRAALPIQLGCQLTVTPYLSFVDSLQGGPTHANSDAGGNRVGSFEDAGGLSPDDKFYGGVSASWAF